MINFYLSKKGDFKCLKIPDCVFCIYGTLIELRGAIPIAAGMGLPFIQYYIIAIIGNMIPVPFIYFFARKILVWGADKPVVGNFFTWCLEKGEKVVKNYKPLQEKDCL